MDAVMYHKLASPASSGRSSSSVEKFDANLAKDFINDSATAGRRELAGMQVAWADRIGAQAEARPFYQAVGKRMLDLCLALPLFLILSPIIAILMVIAAMDGGRPWFSHRRSGRDGKDFGCLKVRSMVVDAEKRLADLLERDPAAAAEWAEAQKLNHDPRITRFGRFIRRTSLDELPQLWNVIRGDMSMVGPRPIVRDEIPRYGAGINAYMQMRPGITGAWQVSGRNDLSYDERVALDVDYARTASLTTDLRILVMTAVSMLKRTGK